MQIRTTMRDHFTPVRIAMVNKSTNNKGCEEKRNLIHSWWDCTSMQPLWRNLDKLKTELPCDSAIQFLDIYVWKSKTLIQKDICTLCPLLCYL